MKKLFILVISFLLFCSTAWAIPIVQLTDIINDNNRTHFVGFVGIIDSPS
jgi:hypothetical protein